MVLWSVQPKCKVLSGGAAKEDAERDRWLQAGEEGSGVDRRILRGKR